MEKPLLLLLNIGASVGLGLGVSQYIDGFFDFTDKSKNVKAEAALSAANKNWDANLNTHVTQEAEPKDTEQPTEQRPSPTPTTAKESNGATVILQTKVDAGEKKDTPKDETEGITITPSPSPVPDSSPSESQEVTTQTESEPRTPNRSVKGKLHAAAEVLLPEVPRKKKHIDAEVDIKLSL